MAKSESFGNQFTNRSQYLCSRIKAGKNFVTSFIVDPKMSSSCKQRNQKIAAAAAAVSGFGLGTALGYTSLVINDLGKRSAITATNMEPVSGDAESLTGLILNFCVIVASAIYVGLMLDVIGRKRTMIILAPFSALGWLLIAFTSISSILLIGQGLVQFCDGIFSIAALFYITEIAEDHIRGKLGCLFQVLLASGILFSHVVGVIWSHKLLAIICSFVPVIFAISMSSVPESPRYLLSKKKINYAFKSLVWLRQATTYLDAREEFEMIQTSIGDVTAQKNSLRDFLGCLRLQPTILMIVIMFFQQLTGINFIVSHTTDIFDSVDDSIPRHMYTIIIAVMQLIATVFATIFVDKEGRKTLLMSSSAVMCLSLVGLATYYELKDLGMHNSLGWLPISSILFFISGFNVGYGPLPWLLMGELLPQKVKARAVAILMVFNWMLYFAVNKLFQCILHTFNIQTFCWIFAVSCVFAFVVVVKLLPETLGKSIDEIARCFCRTTEERDVAERETLTTKERTTLDMEFTFNDEALFSLGLF